MPKKLSASIIIAIVAVVVVVGLIIFYMTQTNNGANTNLNEKIPTVQKPLTIAEQKNLLNELAKPVASDTKPINQSEQVKLLEQLAKPVESKAASASGTVVDLPKAKAFTIDEQMKLLEQLKAR